MTTPIKAALRHPAVTIILIAMAVALGIHAFRNMPRMEDPSITIRTGLVFAAYPGATSEQVEQQVTKTLEAHLFRYPEIRKDKTFSTSRPGLCIINMELEDSVKQADVFWAKLRQNLDLAKATELPREVMGPIINSDFGDTVALLIAIRGQRYGYRELTDYVDRIKDEVRQVREVGKLATYGGQNEQIRISASLDRLSQYFANPMDTIQALQQRNIILRSGNLEVGASKVPMRTTGAFTAEEEVRKVMVGLSRTGQPVYIQDFAQVERLYSDPTFLVRYDGDPCVLLAVEMQKGKNIVQMGEKLSAVFQRMERTLPPDLKMDFIANQPQVVEERISGLTHEFLLAIGSVILVTILLLPIRVALIAALAIPITMLATLGAMNGLGVELHQVSIAALIVVLGIVVDDAIVIADNYIELLDHQVPRAEAAWRCATEVVVPVTTATLTIISSFLPLLILAGSSGEFIFALPITVAVALVVSFCVAIFLTPLLSHTFIKQGLHAEEGQKAGGFDMLGRLQAVYNRAIAHFMAHHKQAILLGVAAFLLGLGLMKVIPQQFFPAAERDQFVIDVWMPAGTRIASTDQVMRRIEGHLAKEGRVAHMASFVGQSAPRFYYNVNPQQPDESYGQFIIQSKSAKATPGLVADLQKGLGQLVPEAMVLVKELQQGSQQEAPVEVRISGPELGELRRLGDQVQGFMREASFSRFIHTDGRNDSMLLDVDVNQELVNRLGLSNALVSGTLAGAFDGAPVSTFWEGDRAVAITLRLAPENRNSFGDVKDAYITSPLTRTSAPVRAVATLKPEWQNSRIVHRNGVRTLTVRAFTERGHYGSELLRAIDPKVKGLQLPTGYRIAYGGEIANQNETFPQMVLALCISLVGIFLILLIQFRTISDPLVVMSSIPLALFGAMAGLLLTGNPFGLTAFIGLISLCGIVVRNGIILVDYIKEKVAEGHSLEQAAMEAGERRLRPIFLTTMAAAVGVTPMILSRSAMWSPLASVIAVGLIFSMFFTLLVVPVLYVMVESKVEQRHHGGANATSQATGLALLLACLALPLQAQETQPPAPRKVTVNEAIQLALTQSSAVKIARAAVQENRAKVTAATGDYFPQLSLDAT
ncbi:efflux RND transporter permease subunit [Geothrix sp. PMB-07]|uniref:efflux RND transporter permease subunit n=1 Tax=Geothrix sp. PMB-07 TaxID=3068640 RepID=UPI002740CEA6|nr:efflux RND transporter permease subunit [Geothrix sp. PMB-07]WLT30529.1 efflux RND transporter permease subunit [Geothrix sp. PMB-07]